MSDADYRINISIDQASLDALYRSKYSLYGLLAFQSSDPSGMPLVWFRSQAYSMRNVIELPGSCEAYTSFSTATSPDRVIRAGFSVPILPGQLLTLAGPGGTGRVGPGAYSPEAISILNGLAIPFGCGISLAFDGTPSPICLLPLYGSAVQSLAALPQILLMFSTASFAPGTVVAKTSGPGLLVDLGQVEAPTVGFDINRGWRWDDGAPWATSVESLSEIAELLNLFRGDLVFTAAAPAFP
jgi:hypothetical protein